MKRATRITAILSLLCLLIGAFAPAASALSEGITGGTVNGIRWEFDYETKILSFSGSGALYGSISEFGPGEHWCPCSTQTVILGEGITGLYNYAFKGASFMTTVYLPESMEYIDEDAFLHGPEITDVYYAGAPGAWEEAGFASVFPGDATIHFAKEDSYTWYQEGNIWYCLRNGKQCTGWQKIDGNWYYFDGTGAMQTGWKKLDGKWYYMDAEGIMQTGWKDMEGYRYYFQPNGVAADKDTLIDGQWHRFDAECHWLGKAGGWSVTDQGTSFIQADGTLAKGWKQIDKAWYYFNTAGIMQTGWLILGTTVYYLYPETGKLATGLQRIEGDLYYFNSEGAAQTGWRYLSGNWYYFLNDGAAAVGKLTVGGSTYLFDGEGKMLVGFITDEEGRTYYTNSSGAMQVGFKTIGGYQYYFYKDGHMAKDTIIDGYSFNKDGIAVQKVQKMPLINYHWGSNPAQAAEAEKVAKSIALDAMKNGGKTDYEKISYAKKSLRKRYYTSYSDNIPLGPEFSIYGPLVMEMAGNGSDNLAMGRILDYMGYEWIGYNTIYLKMDGEYGYIDIWGSGVGFGNPSDKGDYMPLLSASQPANTPGSWVYSQGKWSFKNSQGKRVTGWHYIGNQWYFFGKDGIMKTGWHQEGGKWYYLISSGAMRTGWMQKSGVWYFFYGNGVMATGKFFANGAYYYADKSGAMLTGWKQIGGKWYYMNSNGEMAIGFKTVGGVDYCFNSQGQMYTGWFEDDRALWYYATKDGRVVKGWASIGGKYYYFYKDGHMAKDTFIDNYFIDKNGVWTSTVSVNRDPQHYKYLTAQQAAQADAIAKRIADEAKARGTTEYEQVEIAAKLVQYYVEHCNYDNDENYYYRSPYGVFVEGVFTCAGATRAMGRVLELMGYKWYHPGEDQWDHQWVCVKVAGEYMYIDVQKVGLFMGYGNHLDNYAP